MNKNKDQELNHENNNNTTKQASSLDALDHNLRRHWYPMSFSKHLVQDTPVGLHLLGDPIVLFRDSNGLACCLADICAHRSAPLSIGRITNGTLECKYHGWRYDNRGKVVEIPALEKSRKIPRSACTRVYPCREVDNLVWVYPGTVVDDPHLPPIPNLVPGKRNPEWCKPFDFAVDLNIDHSLMVENLLDPAHLPFTHENTLAKRSDATAMVMEHLKAHVDANDSSFSKIEAVAKTPERNKPPVTFLFQVPCTVIISTDIKPGWKFEQSMSCVPTRPGHMRLIFRQGRTFAKWLNHIPWIEGLQTKYSLKIVMQDYELLHGQQTRLFQHARPWNVPIQVDSLPSMYRNWHSRALAQFPPWFQGYNLDLEDLDQLVCAVSTSKSKNRTMRSNRSNPSVYYDEAVVPNQMGVDNSAYTSPPRSSKNERMNISWSNVISLIVVVVAVVSLAYYKQAQALM